MGKKSKWFVIATEGATTDGRKISREWLEQMAKNYDPKNTYGARINLEHIKFRYFSPDEPHSKSYGDVTSLKLQERDDGKLQLLAQIQPTNELISLVKSGQKIYTSVEIDPSFADTGEAYLVGLAVTDNPASLGTQILSFAAQAEVNPFSERKNNPTNLFSEAIDVLIQFDENESKSKTALVEKIKALFNNKNKTDDDRFKQQEMAIEFISEKLADELQHLATLKVNVDQELKRLNEFNQRLTQIEQQLQQLSIQPQFTERPVVTGSENKSSTYF
ncbi:capsid scaffolding protein [Mergibacter septicus]|uniref:Capsid scaffolding protein n=1 Tax=Mergibacter septicus TaxID=221402 RepID=A0A8E3MGS3_9PAST|nr:GPO family capsid scaffolding protein [Mergibacter septicus]AWX15612.1 capsid scaffolding protein [Mergibacter septicus]QDJ14866.1 capsid scaffolding protein [Mergibacter septicus]UTU47706.1 GPO family capsid scaffolding protein [Mergibacter septicus]WMR96687.1 GPO family capsid scaffolding protein [Mergibacter septicus]